MKRFSLRYVINLICATFIILCVAKITSFGWWFGPTRTGSVVSITDPDLADRLKRSVERLSVGIGIRNTKASLERTVGFISDELRSMGYEPQERSYSVNGRVYKNLVAILPAKDKTAETILVGAHYDSCFNPGADDNASGVAGVLELARALKGTPVTKHVMFVFFANEEPPFFYTEAMGSRVFAKEAREAGLSLKAAVVLEMIGYYSDKPWSQRYLPLLGPFFPNRADFICFVSDIHSWHLLGEMESVFRKFAAVPLRTLAAPGNIKGINFSDHASFWRQGYRAIMVTDTAYLRNPYYHTDHDLPKTLDYHRMAGVVVGLTNVILRWAKESE